MSFSRRVMLKRRLRILSVAGGACLGTAALAFSACLLFIHHRDTTGQGGFEVNLVPVSAEVQDKEFIKDSGEEENVFTRIFGHNLVTEEYSEEVEKAELEMLESIESTDVDELADFELFYQSYRVKKGDVISLIAERYGVTEDTLISVNNIHSSRLLQIGQYLKVPSTPGILYKTKSDEETPQSVAEKFNVNAAKCALANNLEAEDIIGSGKTVFVPDAKLDRITRLEINGDLFKKPIHASYRLSSPYGYRQSPFNASRRTFHTGIDMACPQGTLIYAALEGTVTTAGYSDVFGNYVIITHHSGYKTLYGHMSKILVSKGNYVTTATKIGKVGSTGLSTGPHLHFTVYKDNRTMNPLKLF